MAENMENSHREEDNRNGSNRGWVSFIIRFVVAAIVLMVTAFLTPGFSIMGFWTALLAALVIAGLNWVAQKLFKIDASPFGKGIVGFIVAAAIIYITQFIVPDMSLSIWGAIIAALIIGVIEIFIPTDVV